MAFNLLPIELNKEIASHLETDRDICNFRRTCQSTRNAVDGDNYSFWRGRFNSQFDKHPGNPSAKELRNVYQNRKYMLLSVVDFGSRKGREVRMEKGCLAVMRDLIRESFNGQVDLDEFGRPASKNLEWLTQVARETNLLRDMYSPRLELPNTLREVIQIILAHLSLDLDCKMHAYCFEESQKMAYTSSLRQPVFKKGGDVNFTWLRHTLNFFKNHVINESSGLLATHLKELSIGERPSPWSGTIESGVSQLGTYWKGTYSYIEHKDIEAIRLLPAGERFFSDGHLADDGEGKNPVQTLALDFSGTHGQFYPEEFETILQAKPKRHTRPNRAQRRGHVVEEPTLYFEGRGTDDEDFLSAGHVSAINEQCGIPGWQRMTMMKYYRIEETEEVDMEALWAYEGVVLPGGKIIIGRWWAPDLISDNGEVYSGPFILWNVAAPEFEKADSVMGD